MLPKEQMLLFFCLMSKARLFVRRFLLTMPNGNFGNLLSVVGNMDAQSVEFVGIMPR